MIHETFITEKGNQIKVQLNYDNGMFRLMICRNVDVIVNADFRDPHTSWTNTDAPKVQYKNIKGDAEFMELHKAMKRFIKSQEKED